ncbi:hypothetical protein Tco_0785443 [Tanacetum coccineum]
MEKVANFKDAPTSLKKWKDKFFLIDHRAAPIAMPWRHHDSNVADPFPHANEFNESDAERLREVVITLHKPAPSLLYAAGLSHNWKHVGHVPILKVGTLLSPGAARVTHLTPPANKPEDNPPKDGRYGDCRDLKVAGKRHAGEEGTSRKKKRKVRQETPTINLDSEHVSSPMPLNHSKPLEVLADKAHASTTASAARLDALRNQTDKQSPSPNNVVNDNMNDLMEDGNASDEQDQHLESLRKPARDKAIVETAASYSAERFGDLPFTPQWGLTDSSQMENCRDCRDMMSNLSTPTDDEFLNEKGVPDGSAVKRSWRLMCQSAQQQANVLLRLEHLSEANANLAYAHESCKEMKAQYKACKKEVEELEGEKKGLVDVNAQQTDRIKQLEEALRKSEEDAHELRVYREKFVVKCGNREMMRRKIVNEYLFTFVRRLHQSAEYKLALGKVFSLSVGKGFIDGISIGWKEEDIQPILAETSNVDPIASSMFMEEYEKLFDKRYPYADEVASAYLLNPSGLQNVMPDETGPTPGQRPRATPTTSYA